jgi:UDP-2-acetamido-3-amino-2,3-dideoxy-glucuronate N-acetyltransferase
MGFQTWDYNLPSVKILQGCIYGDDLECGEGSILCSNTVIKSNVKIGKNTIIAPLCVIEDGAIIGDNVTLQPFCVIARDTVIQDNVFIAPHFSCANDFVIPTGEHGSSKNKKPYKAFPMMIKKGARIGTRCTVAPNVTIGEDVFIKMNCFIKKNVPDGTVIEAGTTWG